jgi:hypothetical protein
LSEALNMNTRKTTPSTFDEQIYKLKEVQQDGLQYCRKARNQEKFKDVDGLARNRLRCFIWKQWKKPVFVFYYIKIALPIAFGIYEPLYTRTGSLSRQRRDIVVWRDSSSRLNTGRVDIVN